MIKKYGYVRVGAVTPKVIVANVEENAKEIIKEIKKADKKGIQILTFPELAITGYTCGDLFYQNKLLNESLECLKEIMNATKNLSIISLIGMPLLVNNALYNVSIIIQKGNILGVVPKTNIANEYRWFNGYNNEIDTIELFDKEVPFGTNILFQDNEDKRINFGIEIAEDLLSINPPSNDYVLGGATMIFNLAATPEVVGAYEYRKNLIQIHSAKLNTAYIYVSAGINESTTDGVYAGHSLIYENGHLLKESKRFEMNPTLIETDIDVEKIINERYKNNMMLSNGNKKQRIVKVNIKDNNDMLNRNYDLYPFVPNDDKIKQARCEEIINIQACGLVKRLQHIHTTKTVIGISGGLDSTLAFLIIVEAYKKLGIDNKNIIAVTMPGFGTTGRTYQNAINLIKLYGATLKEVNIKEACLVHFKDIEQKPNKFDITFENAQARERTQILMDIANKEGGLVVGTGDLSELALGWCTYNGDHMSMYAVNCDIPKTLVQYLVKWIADNTEHAKELLYDILDTPISPELLPTDDKGQMVQKTESSVGPYILHDFFLYHFLRNKFTPVKIFFLAHITFKDIFTDEEIKKWLTFFIKRFFTQQFKRNCIPDGPKVGSVGLSPRGELLMPSDAEYNIWLKDLENI